MPIVDENSAPPIEQPATVQIAAPEYKGVVVDTRYIPAKALLARIEGSSWTVNYYSQVLNDDSALAGQNVDRNAIYQQYRLIKGMDLKVTAPLITSQDQSTNAMVLTGSANVYPFLIPNLGDMFVADIGDGRAGIFKVTHSEKKSIFKDAIYLIEYQLIDYATPLRQGDLDSKVIQTLQFVKDYLMHGQNPLLFEDEYLMGEQLQTWYNELVLRYFKAFMSNEFRTLLVPGQEEPTYDAFLVKAMLAIVDTREAPQIRHCRQYNMDGDDAFKSTTVWDALLQRDKKLLRVAGQQTGLIFATMMPSDPMMEGIYYSGIQYLVYPKDPELFVDWDFLRNSKQVLQATLERGVTSGKSLMDIFADQTTLAGLPYKDSPLNHEVMNDDFYVFSQNFYDNTQDPATQSKLELAVRDYLDGKALDNKLLLTFCELCHSWGPLERFYFIPVLLILLKASIRSI